MLAPTTMWPLEAWLAANGIPRSTFYYHQKHEPRRIPTTVRIGKRLYVTQEAATEYRQRLMAVAEAEQAEAASKGEA